MHNITRRATEFVNPLLAFQQVGKFWSFPVTNIPFLWQLLMRDTSWVAQSKMKKNPIRVFFFFFFFCYSSLYAVKTIINYGPIAERPGSIER